MNFPVLLCVLFHHLNNEKSPNAGYHLLRGKRSGQSVQDVKHYEVHSFFGIYPKLSKEAYKEAVQQLEREGFITIDESIILHLTNKGEALVQATRPFYFDGWNYRGREEIFFARLSLIVQTVSYFKNGVKQFMPIQRNPEIQHFVKGFLSNYSITDSGFAAQVKMELYEMIEKSGMNDVQKQLFTHRLVGYDTTGWTWGQLGEQFEMAPIDVKLLYIESLHMFLNTVIQTDGCPLLKEIAAQIKVENYLNYSTRQTKQLFEQGRSPEEIGSIRRLKASTIEDHFVEMALDDPAFPFYRFVTVEDCLAVQKKSKELNTKRLRVLKESFPQLSYFQIRLILCVPVKGGRAK